MAGFPSPGSKTIHEVEWIQMRFQVHSSSSSATDNMVRCGVQPRFLEVVHKEQNCRVSSWTLVYLSCGNLLATLLGPPSLTWNKWRLSVLIGKFVNGHNAHP
ncbi:hypothetical protein LOTGIDRAFT_174841 [Lottia gigantea]|uniref:Uncharacterized protein n=1 Tax=Lottia gigantea TaxID=225164 RepID=V3ZXZ7_LOTGI|nr:hypothetical protein LOTGIDRAFT_174841 [Lottia gigantea]ESO96388.1 hypothetical protein LOTGIDRAFT_174841 [Lottia gigantea]